MKNREKCIQGRVKSFIYEKMVQRFREWYEKIFTNIPEITLIEKK